jgi:hypothetical protein
MCKRRLERRRRGRGEKGKRKGRGKFRGSLDKTQKEETLNYM